MGSETSPAESATIDVNSLEICIGDICGVRRCRTFMRNHIPEVVSHGFGLCKAVPFLPSFGDVPVPGSKYHATGEFCVMPDMRTYRKLPWRKSTGFVLGDLHQESGDAADECPRRILRRAMALLKEEFNYDLKIGFEIEFILLDRSVKLKNMPCPRAEHNYGAQNDLVVHAEVIEDIVETLHQLGIDVIHYHPESAYGQYEIAVGCGDPLNMCDNALLARLAIVAVSHKHGFEASFLAKLFQNSAGSGGHVHMSLSQNGADVSLGPTPRALSHETQYFINGMLKHQAAWMIWTAGTPNSFSRYQPHTWTSGYNVWGINNREAMIRVLFPNKGENNSIRFEQRCFDQTVNPHIGIAALIVAGVLGLREQNLLPPKTQGNPHSLSDAELAKKEGKRFPESISKAVSAFQADSAFNAMFTQVSSEDFVTAALASRKQVEKHYSQLGMEAEIQELYNRY